MINGKNYLKINCRNIKKEQQQLWNSFQDPPVTSSTGSAIDTKRFETFKKLLKLFTYILVFLTVLITAIASKISFYILAAYTKSDKKFKYCDITSNI